MVDQATCVRCGLTKSSDHFYVKRQMRSGLSSWCRECYREVRRARYLANKDSVRVQTRAWEKANPDKVHAKYKRRISNPEVRAKRLADARRWSQENADRKRQLWNEWAKSNPEKIKARTLRRAARHNAAAGSATPDQIAARIAFYGGFCWMCGAEGTELDHVIPLAAGGSNWPANLRPACKPCNSRKHARDWRQFVRQLSRR